TLPSFEVPHNVKALPDPAFLRKRILSNLLASERDFLPSSADFLREVQKGCISGEHRRILGEWMRDVVFEVGSGPETFVLAMNLLDRFLSLLQLLGSVALLVASKVRDSENIPGQSSSSTRITALPPKKSRLTLLFFFFHFRLGWEINGITPFDYLDHLLPRLSFPPAMDEGEFRKFAETILVLVANEYDRIAASAILIAVRRLSEDPFHFHPSFDLFNHYFFFQIR
ncbi:G1/S-specific cyclin-D2, partial [Caligus rogercresseyi]